MAEYIDREAAILKMKVHTAEAVANNATNAGFYSFIQGFQKLFIEELQECVLADVAPVKHGKWIQHEHAECLYLCSECSIKILKVNIAKSNYCPNCGALMNMED